MKIQTKIALLFTLVCTLIMVALSSIIYYYANEKAFQDFYGRLELRATIAAKTNVDSDPGDRGAYEQVRYQYLQQLPEEKEYIIPIDSLKYFINNKQVEDLPQSFYNEILNQKRALFRRDYQFYEGILYQSPKGAYVIIISAVHSYAQNFLLSLKNILLVVNLVSPLLIFGIGVFFSKQILAPIRKITREVKNINATSLNNRLTVQTGKDEIAELGDTFNRMLARLETSFETQNNFVSNASHELNTPLTTIIGEAEFALSKNRTPEQYQQGISIILAQAEKLMNIIKSLLELAQSGFTTTLSSETVMVSELIRNVLKVSGSIYPDCKIKHDTSLEPEDINNLTVQGNFHLLELCLSNIVLNACKYSTGEVVTLAVAQSEKDVVFIVTDKGIGIPGSDMPHIFDPFFRASNARQSKGYGIGLPLAQNIIKLHNGSIQLTSKESEGTEVVVKIPAGR